MDPKFFSMSITARIASALTKIDTVLTGFFLGLILPMLMFVVYYEARFSYLNWDDYIKGAKDLSVLPSFIKVCVFINLPFFFLFNLFRKFNICLGLFIASLIYILAMIGIKYF